MNKLKPTTHRERREIKTDLISRLEAASEGSGQLDQQIDELFGRQSFVVPFYTTSLDACKALQEEVLPGWALAITRTPMSYHSNPSEYTVQIFQHYNMKYSDDYPKFIARHKDECLAYCIAILKAQAALDQKRKAALDDLLEADGDLYW